MSTRAAQAGFAILKRSARDELGMSGPMSERPEYLHQRYMGDEKYPVPEMLQVPDKMMGGRPQSQNVVNEAAELFVGTCIAHLEGDQEQYVAQHLPPNASMEDIEAGRKIAIDAIAGLLRSM